MPARNIHHDQVVRALIADGWTITHDPLTLSFGGRDLFVDLGAERTALAAEKSGRKIAVEIQSFLGASSSAISRRRSVNMTSTGPYSPRRIPNEHCILPYRAE